MQFKSILRISPIILLLVSCTNDSAASKLYDEKANGKEKDSLSSEIAKLTTAKKKNSDEQRENLKVIEKKYGEQWGFCECVLANDSINDAIMATTNFEGPKFDKLMKRSDLVTKKCQAFLSLDANRTPAERANHERKVKKCLSNAKKT